MAVAESREVKSKGRIAVNGGLVPLWGSIPKLAEKAKNCRNCDLWRNATQTVFDEGGLRSRIMFIGEQPGNEEDKERKPFVGPAGRLLDRMLVEAGIDRKKVYVTNANHGASGAFTINPVRVRLTHAGRGWTRKSLRLNLR